jgi:hypothetical protein
MDPRQQIVEQVFNYFVREFQQKFSGQLAALYVVGSFSVGKMSLERPDLNFLLILEGIDPEDHILLGRVFQEAITRFSGIAGIRPYFSPVRFVYPEKKEAYDVFVSTVVLDSRKQDLALPFGITRWVLEGYVQSRRLLAGTDILGQIELPPIRRVDLLERSLVDLEFYRLPLEKAPVQYRDNEMDLLLSEAVILGKAIVHIGVEVAMSDDELNRHAYMDFFSDPALFSKFYQTRYGAEAAGHAKLILDARNNFSRYKIDNEKIMAVYESAVKMVDLVEQKIRSATA